MAWLTTYTPTTPNFFQEFSLSDNTSHKIAVRKMERCVTNIRQWMKTNMLKLNDDKTEILIIRPKSANQHLLPESVRIGNTDVTPNMHARNLGVTFDCNMSLERHVTNISRTAYYHLHSIGRNLSLFRTRTHKTASACPCHITNWLLQQPPEWTVSGGSWKTTARPKCLCSCYTNSTKTRPRHAQALGAALASC